VHELGHYLAARLCKVRVETFSLGFGPTILGRRIGPTYYQIAAIPLGGFCRMAGEERRLEGLPPEPDELPAKSVGARFFIYSGGVIMNMLFGLVVFPILFQIGVPFTSPVIGETIPGGAAWRASVPERQEIVSVNGHRVFEFEQLFTEVALGDPRRATLVLRDPASGEEHTYELTPERDQREGLSTIGVTSALERDADGRLIVDVEPGSPAERAGLKSGVRVADVIGGPPGLDVMARLSLLMSRGEPLDLRLETDQGPQEVRITPQASSELDPPRVGITTVRDRVVAVRDTPLVSQLGLAKGDRLVEVNGQRILRQGDFPGALLASSAPLHLRLRRGDRTLEVDGPALSRETALRLADDVALGSDEESTRVVVQAGDPAALAGLRDLDEVISIDGVEVTSWEQMPALVERASREERPVSFRVRREGAQDLLTIQVLAARHAAMTYGLLPRKLGYVYRSPNLGAAMVFGVRYSWHYLRVSWLTLKRMLTRDVSPKHVGGIITITAVSYSLTKNGWIEFLFFLCLVSINLAFLNVLPIPVLDGGHLFFLIIEKLKGSPVSNRVLGTSQAVGVILLLSLMVYVTYNDLVRFVFQP